MQFYTQVNYKTLHSWHYQNAQMMEGKMRPEMLVKATSHNVP